MELGVSFKIQFDKAVMIYEIANSLCPDSLRGRLIPKSQLLSYLTNISTSVRSGHSIVDPRVLKKQFL